MKKFRFRFEAIAKVRSIELQQQAKKLAIVEQEIAELRQKIEELRDLIKQELIRVNKAVEKEAFDEQLLRESRSYQVSLELQIQDFEKKLRELSHKKISERNLLIEKQKNKSIFDKLEEKDYEKFLDEAKKLEEKELDEAGSNSWILRHRLGHDI